MIIVDSTVIIDIWRGRSNLKSVLKPYSNQTICISAITLAEIYDGLGYTKEKKSEEIFSNQRPNRKSIV